jgi:hypothetical protein
MKNPKNLLVQYQGGNYSGCAWEWNFFVFDNNGVFYNVISTGRNGVKDEAEALAIVSSGDGSVYKYKLNTKKGLAELAKEINEGWLLELCKFFSETLPYYGVYMLCSECGCQISADDATENCILDDYGNDPLCPDCQYECTCAYCGERVDEDYLVRSLADVETKVYKKDIPERVKQDIVDNNAPLCVYCFEEQVGRALSRLIQESKNETI